MNYSPWGHKEVDTTKATKQAFRSSHTGARWIKTIGRGGRGSREHPTDIALPPPAKEL